jgi:hypothetical protein
MPRATLIKCVAMQRYTMPSTLRLSCGMNDAADRMGPAHWAASWSDRAVQSRPTPEPSAGVESVFGGIRQVRFKLCLVATAGKCSFARS